MRLSPAPQLLWQGLDRRSFRRQRLKEWGIAIALSTCVFLVSQCSAKAAPRHYGQHTKSRIVHDANGNSVIGGRPAGCPTAFCGCGLRKYLGIDDPRLNLAAMWARLYPRTNPHPGAVAVRSHHVFLLKEHLSGSVWKVLDFNSGHHLTRIHPRSIAGWKIVEPSRQLASAQ